MRDTYFALEASLVKASSSSHSRPSFFRLQQQILQYLKDMFDHDKVRFTSAQCLAEDILKLSHRRSEILLGYLGISSLLEVNGALSRDAEGTSGPN